MSLIAVLNSGGETTWRAIAEASARDANSCVDADLAAAARGALLRSPNALVRSAVLETLLRRCTSSNCVQELKKAALVVIVVTSLDGVFISEQRLRRVESAAALRLALEMLRLDGGPVCGLLARSIGATAASVTAAPRLRAAALVGAAALARRDARAFDAHVGPRCLVEAALSLKVGDAVARLCVLTLIDVAERAAAVVLVTDTPDSSSAQNCRRRVHDVLSLLQPFTDVYSFKRPIDGAASDVDADVRARWTGCHRALLTLLRNGAAVAMLASETHGLRALARPLGDAHSDARLQSAIVAALGEAAHPLLVAAEQASAGVVTLAAVQAAQLAAALLGRGVVGAVGDLAISPDRPAASIAASALWRRLARLLRLTLPAEAYERWLAEEPLRLHAAAAGKVWSGRRLQRLLDALVRDTADFPANGKGDACDAQLARRALTHDAAAFFPESDAKKKRHAVSRSVVDLVHLRNASLEPWAHLEAPPAKECMRATMLAMMESSMAGRMKMDSASFNHLLDKTKILSTKEWRKWDWRAIDAAVDAMRRGHGLDDSAVLTGTAEADRVVSDALRSKFVKRLGGFFRCDDIEPNKASFASLPWTPANLRFLRTASRLYACLLAVAHAVPANLDARAFLEKDRRGSLLQAVSATISRLAPPSTRARNASAELLARRHSWTMTSMTSPKPAGPPLGPDRPLPAPPPGGFKSLVDSLFSTSARHPAPRDRGPSSDRVPERQSDRPVSTAAPLPPAATPAAATPHRTSSPSVKASPSPPRRPPSPDSSATARVSSQVLGAFPRLSHPRKESVDKLATSKASMLDFEATSRLLGREFVPLLLRATSTAPGAALVSPAGLVATLLPLHDAEPVARAVLAELDYDAAKFEAAEKAPAPVSRGGARGIFFSDVRSDSRKGGGVDSARLFDAGGDGARALLEAWLLRGSDRLGVFAVGVLRCMLLDVAADAEAQGMPWQLRVLIRLASGRLARPGIVADCIHVDDEDDCSQDSSDERSLPATPSEMALASLPEDDTADASPVSASARPQQKSTALLRAYGLAVVDEFLAAKTRLRVDLHPRHADQLASPALRLRLLSAPSDSLLDAGNLRQALHDWDAAGNNAAYAQRQAAQQACAMAAFTQAAASIADPSKCDDDDEPPPPRDATSDGDYAVVRGCDGALACILPIEVDAQRSRALTEEHSRRRSLSAEPAPDQRRRGSTATSAASAADDDVDGSINPRLAGVPSEDEGPREDVAPMAAARGRLDLLGLARLPWRIKVGLFDGAGRAVKEAHLVTDAFLDVASEVLPLVGGVEGGATAQRHGRARLRGAIVDARGCAAAVALRAAGNAGATLRATLMIGDCDVGHDGRIYHGDGEDANFDEVPLDVVKRLVFLFRRSETVPVQARSGDTSYAVAKHGGRCCWLFERGPGDEDVSLAGLEFSIVLNTHPPFALLEPHLYGELAKTRTGRGALQAASAVERCVDAACLGEDVDARAAALFALSALSCAGEDGWRHLRDATRRSAAFAAFVRRRDEEVAAAQTGSFDASQGSADLGDRAAAFLISTLVDLAHNAAALPLRFGAQVALARLASVRCASGVSSPRGVARYLRWGAPDLDRAVSLLPVDVRSLFDKDLWPRAAAAAAADPYDATGWREDEEELMRDSAELNAEAPRTEARDSPEAPLNSSAPAPEAAAASPAAARAASARAKVAADLAHLICRVSQKTTAEKIESLKRAFAAAPTLSRDFALLETALQLLADYAYEADARAFVFRLFAPLLRGAGAAELWKRHLADDAARYTLNNSISATLLATLAAVTG
ncbi:hypothetical protein M885DRAFT_514576 [Pelagophyceae sp. CCMP2097]|nr:hypothetical protein M885DRAFT_514576 [Pelagophyceae sp. CCMP2097]